MFNFFKKIPNPNNIKNFQDILNLIDFYIDEKRWEIAHKTLNETIEVETKNAENEIKKLDKNNEKDFNINKDKINNILKINIIKLEKLKDKLEKDEEKYRFLPDRIKKYKDAIKSIKTLIILKEWKEVEKAVTDITKIEKDAFDNLLKKLEKEFKDSWNEVLFETEKKKQLKIYNKKEVELQKLLQKSKNLEIKYNKKIEEAKFKIRFRRIKDEVELLIKTGKNPEALNLLKHFLEENKQNSSVINFYNKEKEKILKNIEKIKEIENKKIEKNIKLEASKLIWQTIKIGDEKEDKKSDKKDSFFKQIKNKINFYHKIKEKLRKKQLIDEVTLLIEENKKLNSEIATKKLENIHKWLVKEINPQNINWYDLYWKILWADKISGDTFWLVENDKKYNLFLWDATGHWIKAWLIVTLLTRLFNNNAKNKSLKELAFIINNWLKQDLESRNFITWILFQINKNKTGTIEYVWMWHEPMLVYRSKSKIVEKFIPGWLAAGIRIIKEIDNIKDKKIDLENWDILLTYSDWVLESKWIKWDYYWLDRLKDTFLKISQIEDNSEKIYRHIIDNLVAFRGWSAFDDDTTMLILKRDENSDIQKKDSDFIKTLLNRENLDSKDSKKLIWKNKEDILKELKNIKKEKELKSIVRNLKKLYHIWEFLKLKQESIRYIKEWWVHKDINFYLKKAMSNEVKYKINLKNKKIENRYNILKQLYKKWDYDTVIREAEDIISKDWEI